MRLPFINRHARWREMASANADGGLGARDAARFERHAAGCEECRELEAETRNLRAMLGALPEVQVPRSFRLTPAMAARERRPAPSRKPGYVVRGAQLSAGFAAAALAVVVVVDVVPSDGGDDGATLSAPAARDAVAPMPEARGLATSEASPAFSQEQQASGTSTAPEPTGTAVAAGGSVEASPASGDGGVSGAGSRPGEQPTTAAPDQSPAPPATGPGQVEDDQGKAASPAQDGGERTADSGVEAEALHAAATDGGEGEAGFRIAEGVLGGLLMAAIGAWGAAWFVRRRRA